MSIGNSKTSFGSVTKVFHWLTALLIITLIPLGIIAHELPYDTSQELAKKAWLFSLHKTLGVLVFFVALARIFWALGQPKPSSLHPNRRLENFAAETVHWLLYGSLVAVPLSGWIHHAATTGFAPIWWPFGQSLPFIPLNATLAKTMTSVHWILNIVLVLSLGAHIAGALKHHIIDKDATLRRMWFGKTDLPETADSPSHQTRHLLPPIAALCVWAAALLGGSAAGLFDSAVGRDAATAQNHLQIEDAGSDWAVQEGAIALTVIQMGSEVKGEFAQWTSAINFDDTITDGVAGSVKTQIAINSLSLGTISETALSEEYFNAAVFASATYEGDLISSAQGYRAEGHLTLRGVEIPVDFPFTLSIDEDVATMAAELTLDRRDFSIGDAMTDAGSLGFEVKVSLELTATRP